MKVQVISLLLLAALIVPSSMVLVNDSGPSGITADHPNLHVLLNDSGNVSTGNLSTSPSYVSREYNFTTNRTAYVAQQDSSANSLALGSGSYGHNVLNIIDNKLLPGNFSGWNFNQPTDTLYDNVSNYLYVSDPNSNFILAMRERTVIAGIEVFSGIVSMTYNSHNGLLYATSSNQHEIAVIDGTTLQSVINLPMNATAVGYNPLNNTVYAAAQNMIYLIKNNTIISNFSSNFSPRSFELFDPYNGYMYISASDGVAVYCGSKMLNFVREINAPNQMAYNPSNHQIYVTGYLSYDGIIWLINGTVLNSSIPVYVKGNWATDLYGISIDPQNGYIYVSRSWYYYNGWPPDPNDLLVINGSLVIGDISLGEPAGGMSYFPSTQSVVAPMSGNPSYLLSVSGKNRTSTVYLGVSLSGSAYDPVDHVLYLANDVNNTIVEVVNNSVASYILDPGNQPNCIIYDSFNGYVYISNTASNTVSVLGQFGFIGTISVGSRPTVMALNANNGEIYVGNQASWNISVISGRHVIGSISVGGSPNSMTFDSFNGFLYAAIHDRWTVSIISNLSIIDNLTYLESLNTMAFDPQNGMVYATTSYSQDLTVISNRVISGTISLGGIPSTVAYDSGGGKMYVIFSNGTADLVNGYSVLDPKFLCPSPASWEYDWADSTFYVASAGSGIVSLINSTLPQHYVASFAESGLPAGTLWAVTVYGIKNISASSDIAFNLSNGNYSYRISFVETGGIGYKPVELNGSFSINGTGVSVPVTFNAVSLNTVTINETGLPIGTRWWMNTSLGQSYSVIGNTISLSEPSMLINFTANGPGRIWRTVVGNISVNGSGYVTTINFTEFKQHIALTIFPTFGLTYGVPLYVNFSGSEHITWNGDFNNSTVPYLYLNLTNGTYGYNIRAESGIYFGVLWGAYYFNGTFFFAQFLSPPGSLVVTGPGYIYSQVAVIACYNEVVFRENGLPSGVNLGINVSGRYANQNFTQEFNKAHKNTMLFVYNGTYNYASSVTGSLSLDGHSFNASRQILPIGGRVVVNGTFNISLQVGLNNMGWSYYLPVFTVYLNFSLRSYNLSINETGLPPGYNWEIGIGGKIYSFNHPDAVVLLPVGEYKIMAISDNNDYFSNYTADISLNNSTSIHVEFQKYVVATDLQNAMWITYALLAAIIGELSVIGILAYIRRKMSR
ncbi:MAG: hypothetical protein ACYDAZ_01650 [Thermoplasmataceae archaeon]